MSFVKLDSGLIHSTVWRGPMPTRIVWITMLAMANKHGEVMASVPGLADAARVTLAEAEAALAEFLGPDQYSRTQEHEGRRIERIPGGWVLLNYAMYRDRESDEERRAREAARAQRYRDRKRAASPPAEPRHVTSVTPRDGHVTGVTPRDISPKQKQKQKQRQKAEAVPRKTTTTDTPPKATYISGETPASPAQRPAPSAVAAVSKSERGKDGKPTRLSPADLPHVKPPTPNA